MNWPFRRAFFPAGDPSPCAVAAAGEAFYLRPTATFTSTGLALQPRGVPVQVLARTQLQQEGRVLYLVSWVGVPYFAAFAPRSLGACAESVPRITVEAGLTAASALARLTGTAGSSAKPPNVTGARQVPTPTVGFLWSDTLPPSTPPVLLPGSNPGTTGGTQGTTPPVPAPPVPAPPVPAPPTPEPPLDWRIPAAIAAAGAVVALGLGVVLASRRRDEARTNPRRRRR